MPDRSVLQLSAHLFMVGTRRPNALPVQEHLLDRPRGEVDRPALAQLFVAPLEDADAELLVLDQVRLGHGHAGLACRRGEDARAERARVELVVLVPHPSLDLVLVGEDEVLVDAVHLDAVRVVRQRSVRLVRFRVDELDFDGLRVVVDPAVERPDPAARARALGRWQAHTRKEPFEPPLHVHQLHALDVHIDIPPPIGRSENVGDGAAEDVDALVRQQQRLELRLVRQICAVEELRDGDRVRRLALLQRFHVAAMERAVGRAAERLQRAVEVAGLLGLLGDRHALPVVQAELLLGVDAGLLSDDYPREAIVDVVVNVALGFLSEERFFANVFHLHALGRHDGVAVLALDPVDPDDVVGGLHLADVLVQVTQNPR
mmetsp:Transcript_26002/g.78339  ORF Transcript_26002/g.78339 Transcript_26002/m.78339 type:complete len:374 (+) Transcript_26002:1869-2990(+)